MLRARGELTHTLSFALALALTLSLSLSRSLSLFLSRSLSLSSLSLSLCLFLPFHLTNMALRFCLRAGRSPPLRLLQKKNERRFPPVV